jgi:DNA-binding PadR family transcriptional regulator
MQRLEAASGGAWRPSPGSVYPTLQLLQDEGLVTSREVDGTRVYTITDAGRTEAERRTAEAGSPWAEEEAWPLPGQLLNGAAGVVQAARQIAKSGTEAQMQRAIELVRGTRKQLYQILAED